jgi:hypothetical protein
MKRLPANTSLALMRAPKQGRLVVILAAAAALTTFIGSSPAPACSQDKPEDQVVSVRTLLSRDGVHPGDVFKAAFIVKIRPGYHVNDNAPLDQFLVPTSLSIDDCSSLEVLELAIPPDTGGASPIPKRSSSSTRARLFSGPFSRSRTAKRRGPSKSARP